MNLFLALLGYGYIAFDGYSTVMRLGMFWSRDAIIRRIARRRLRTDRGWLAVEYGVDWLLLGGALYLALTHTLR